MVITSLAGATFLTTSGISLITKTFSKESKMKNLIDEVLEMAKVEVRYTDGYDEYKTLKPRILKVKKRNYGFDVNLKLPKGYSIEKFRSALPVLEQGTASKIKATHLQGRELKLELGMMPLRNKMDFTEALTKQGQPSIPYYTPFGIKYISFWDETCCHIIVAGATRMGKSVFLRLMFTTLTLAMDGKVRFFYVNNKIEDYGPMRGIPQIPEPAETIPEAHSVINDVLIEMNNRKQKIRRTKVCVNAAQYREMCSDDSMPPVFVVIDEYGRFCEDDDFQEKIQEIAETAGYLDIHLVIATQRPDANTVLKPRIRANILTRVCFQTADENNSKIVVHTPDAAYLDEIRGRAIVLDGMPTLGQIPYVSEDNTAELLLPYRRIIDDTERQSNIDVSKSFPSFEPRPVGATYMPRSEQTVDDSEQNHAKAGKGRTRSANQKAKR